VNRNKLAWLALLLANSIAAAQTSESTAIARSAAVQVEICEHGLNEQDVWPDVSPTATEFFAVPAFGINQIPPKYVDDGIRGTRPSPSLVRLSAHVDLPAGKHRFLIRARSASRLSINGTLVAETAFAPKHGGDGSQNPERLDPLDLGPGFRFATRGEYEKIAEYETPGGLSEVKFELFAGGREGTKPRRVEVGETVVAIAKSGHEHWELLTPLSEVIPYTDSAWKEYQSTVAEIVAKYSAARRAELRDQNAEYWANRREIASTWLSSVPEIAVPSLPAGFPGQTPIDHFIAAKFVSVQSQNRPGPADSIDYFRDVKPLLESRCLECHSGVNSKGGLRLDRAELAINGGDSGPAFEPGQASDSELLRRVRSEDAGEVMPPTGNRLTEAETSLLERWIQDGATWPELPLVRDSFAGSVDEAGFMRRAMLDTVGVPPTAEELRHFVADTSPNKRASLIDRLLEDPRGADHWVPFWQDLLAENPNILNPTLNNTGPFRWWIYESLIDDLPLDRMVTQLVLQRGGVREGGPAGFGEASQNDVPAAAKGAIVGATFMGIDLKCARCHDSPTGAFKQEQLFQLGAMLANGSLDVPTTSSVDPAKLHSGGRIPLIEVTLMPGSRVEPKWPFHSFAQPDAANGLVPNTDDQRERLAALLTAPQHERFAQVIANRVWQRLMGRGIVEPLDDWEKGTPTHPDLLQWLGREFVRGGYQIKFLARTIMNSAAYQRAVDPVLRSPDPLYSACEPRRLSAEQIVDSMFSVTGMPFQTEPMCLDLNGRRETENALDLGTPHRAWMLASLSNERDRPSLTLPRLQAVSDVMSALGWRGARQDPSSTRDLAPNALQPAILANGVMSQWLTRLSDHHDLTEVALHERSVETFVDELFHRLLSRSPSHEEQTHYVNWLSEGFAERVIATPQIEPQPQIAPKLITWTNHLLPESDVAAQKRIAAAVKGDPPSPRLEPKWRARCEDVIWALLNSPEMIYRP
jgi:Protein of unknown function (DUF1553)/Protein of unknown function (DUF1549)/Planctomycete cytochrome C